MTEEVRVKINQELFICDYRHAKATKVIVSAITHYIDEIGSYCIVALPHDHLQYATIKDSCIGRTVYTLKQDADRELSEQKYKKKREFKIELI